MPVHTLIVNSLPDPSILDQAQQILDSDADPLFQLIMLSGLLPNAQHDEPSTTPISGVALYELSAHETFTPARHGRLGDVMLRASVRVGNAIIDIDDKLQALGPASQLASILGTGLAAMGVVRAVLLGGAGYEPDTASIGLMMSGALCFGVVDKLADEN